MKIDKLAYFLVIVVTIAACASGCRKREADVQKLINRQRIATELCEAVARDLAGHGVDRAEMYPEGMNDAPGRLMFIVMGLESGEQHDLVVRSLHNAIRVLSLDFQEVELKTLVSERSGLVVRENRVIFRRVDEAGGIDWSMSERGQVPHDNISK